MSAAALLKDRCFLTFPVPLATILQNAWMPIMDKFVAKANLEHFRKKLAQENDESSPQTLHAVDCGGGSQARLDREPSGPQTISVDLIPRPPVRWTHIDGPS